MQTLARWIPKPTDPNRFWMTTAIAQIVIRSFFMVIWGYLHLSPTRLVMTGILGHGPWLDIGFYLVMTVARVALLGYAALCYKSLLSEAWFDFCCQCVTVGIDTAFIGRLVQQIPSDTDFRNASITSPFEQMLLILFYLSLLWLFLDLSVSVALALIVLAAASRQPARKEVWRLGIKDMIRGFNSPIEAELGFNDIFTSCRNFFAAHTVFRRNARIEPGWFATLRGTIALAGVIITFIYGGLNTVISPGQQFRYPLPKRTVPFPLSYEAGFPDVLHGVMFFKRLDLPRETYQSDPFSAYIGDVGDVLGQFHVNATVGSAQSPCNFQPTSRWDVIARNPAVNLGVSWSCSGLKKAIADQSPVRSSLIPVVRLTWAGNLGVDPILRGYVASVPIWSRDRPWMESFGPFLAWNVSVGTHINLTAGMSVFYARPGTLLDVIGFKQAALEIVGYPVGKPHFGCRWWSDFLRFGLASGVSATSSSSEQPSQTTIEITPFTGTLYEARFDAWEEYTVYTVIAGLVATGGLYSSLDVFFTLLFGRSLIGLVFGIKPISPFGFIMRVDNTGLKQKLLEKYPDLESKRGHNQREPDCKQAEAICEFLCDFVLDTGPIDPFRRNRSTESKKTSQ